MVETKVVDLEKLHNFSIFFSFESIKTENIFVYGEAPRESRNHRTVPLFCFSPPPLTDAVRRHLAGRVPQAG